jgi:hypothetical protein
MVLRIEFLALCLMIQFIPIFSCETKAVLFDPLTPITKINVPGVAGIFISFSDIKKIS